jgi:hypothetical protein
MKKISCEFEQRFAGRNAAREEDLAHLAACSICRDTAIAAAAMDEVSRSPLIEKSLPDPSLIWIKAQIIETRGARERVERPATVATIFAYGMLGFGWALLFWWKWPLVERLLSSFRPDDFIVFSTTVADVVSMPFLAGLVTLVALTGVLTMQTAFAEE